jgi:hypothetical protein
MRATQSQVDALSLQKVSTMTVVIAPRARRADWASSQHREPSMAVYVIVQLKMTDRAAYDRHQARFFDVFRKFSGRLLSKDREAGARDVVLLAKGLTPKAWPPKLTSPQRPEAKAEEGEEWRGRIIIRPVVVIGPISVAIMMPAASPRADVGDFGDS